MSSEPRIQIAVRPIPNGREARLAFNKTLGEMRPKLHRYCARIVGSVIDGEDVVQEALVKAIDAFAKEPISNLESWLFRIAHNAALDFLRRRARQEAIRSEEDPDMIIDDSASATNRHVVAASLRTFMHLPIAQRGCVILMDVLGFSLQEVSDIAGLSIPAVKAALHRGRSRIRDLANSADDEPAPSLSDAELKRLAAYVDRFNAHDFDAVRTMLAADVKLELVSRQRMDGREQVSKYFHNYAHVQDWRLVPGLVDRQPALLVLDPRDLAAPPAYFILLKWDADRIVGIRDFRHARYVAESAEMATFGSPAGSC
jgi:RNA polymerase sigma-70 factor (ECF subfamily)